MGLFFTNPLSFFSMNTRSVQRALNSIMGQGPHPPTAEGMSNGLHGEEEGRGGKEEREIVIGRKRGREKENQEREQGWREGRGS